MNIRKKLPILSGAILLAISSCNFTACTSSEAEVAEVVKESVPATELIKQADNLYKQRDDLAKLREGIALLRRARSANNKNFDSAWKLAQFNYFLGDRTTDDKESERAFKEGVIAAKTAINLDQSKPDGYFWLGANLGGQSKKDVLSGATNVGEIKKNMEKVIEIQPNYLGGAAFDALAQVELNTRLMGGSADKAVELAEKGVAMEKDNSMLRATLAEAYLATNKKDEAKKQLDFIQKMNPNPEFLPEFKISLEKAKKLKEKL